MSAGGQARPWVALALPPLAWYLFELGLAGTLRLSCGAVESGVGVAWGVASAVACLVAMRLAWPLAGPADDDTPSRPWVARVALLGAGVYLLAILFQTIGVLIVPACVR